ncbi:MAG TPA: YdiU family protein [Burkholderiaceae bacterium]|nr:YdiU family protein [Burkholderiaceae bacterium]
MPQIDTALVFTNRFAGLGEAFYTRLQPQPLAQAARWVGFSDAVADQLDPASMRLSRANWLEILAGRAIPAGSAPLASVYSGHQFGVWAGQLGDGRALMLGEVRGADGQHYELQLKGSGKTPYSRMGDGRAVLRSSIREFLCSEAMAGLGIPTTRALGVVGTDDPVIRENVETAAVVLRVAPSFIRFGHFEHFSSRNQHDALRTLADFTIDTYRPELRAAANPYAALLKDVAQRTAEMIAQWQAVGFMHGVMNTDNMSILGLTLDYGPFGFMDGFDAGHICNHSDHQGRYAYHNQPAIGHWNVAALAEALLPLIKDVDEAKAAVQHYVDRFEQAFSTAFQHKLGLKAWRDSDAQLLTGLLELMHRNHPDYTIFFRRLAELKRDDPSADGPVRDLFIDREAFDAWAATYRERLRAEGSVDTERCTAMKRVNPKFVLRNHLAETAIRKSADERDDSEVARLLKVLAAPYDEQPEHEAYAALPPDWAGSLEVSCSS